MGYSGKKGKTGCTGEWVFFFHFEQQNIKY
jgi:hypothetical protein